MGELFQSACWAASYAFQTGLMPACWIDDLMGMVMAESAATGHY